MKTGSLLITRKFRSHIPQFLGLILLLVVGTGFFITLFTIVIRYEETAEEYFINNSYADVTFYGTFGDEDVQTLLQYNGIKSAHGRNTRDFREGDKTIRVITLTDGINIPYIYKGRLPESATECVLLKRNADAMGFSIGDNFTSGGKNYIITGLIASPEYIYMVKNERAVMAQTEYFGVIYVNKEVENNYNEIVVMTDGKVDVEIVSGLINASRMVLLEEQIGYNLYRSDLDEIGTFAYIFPLVFAVLIAVVIYVMLSRTIQKDRKQIGIMKALGASDGKIIGIYLSQFCFAALIGSLIGCVLAVLLCDIIIGIFSSMFVVPTLGFAFYPVLWLGAILVSIILCAFSGLVALIRILPLLPAHAMRPRLPKSGRQLLIERVGFLWKKFSFNTRYALKNTLRNKSRFFAVVLGMCGACGLLSFSFGFNDSLNNTQDKYFNEFADYDIVVSFDPVPLVIEHSAAEQIQKNQKALVLHVDVFNKEHTLAIVENDFIMVKIPASVLQNGVIIPEFFAREWNVSVGDMLEINGYNVNISAIIPQYMGLMIYASFDYINEIFDEIPPIYNTLYGKSDNMAVLGDELNRKGIEFITIDDDKTNFDSIMESIEVLVWFMIACSVVLGFTVLYSVGLINLSAREYEYMFMRVMGYPHKSIITAHIKETILQLILAIPLGFLLGNIILDNIKDEFSGSGFVISGAIYPQSYILSVVMVIGVTAIMAMVTSRHIGKLDIVEGLKAQDD